MKKYPWAVAALTSLAMLAACSSDKPATTTVAAETTAAATTVAADTTAAATTVAAETTAAADPVAAGIAAAKAIVDAATQPPDKIGPSEKLTSKPGKKKVAWLECEQPSCQAITPGFKDATAALGWDLVIIPAKSADQGPAVQQALDQGADYIAHTGSPLATAADQIKAAQAKGVPYVSCYSTDVPDFKNNNLLAQCGDSPGVQANGGLMANWAIVDSKGAAHTLLVNIPDFPVLVAEAKGAKDAYAANCPKCTFDELDVTIDKLVAGEVPAAVASKIQADPSINYIQFTFGDLPAGVADVLKSSNLLEGRKIIGVDFSTQVGLPGIIDGTHAAWSANPKVYSAWIMVDAMARHAVGMENPTERDNAKLPTFIVSSADEAKKILALGNAGWPGPATMADQFKTLWGV